MTNILINGINVPVLEHFKEIKEECANDELFNRWYNRQQFLKAILGNFKNSEGDYTGKPYYNEGDFGTVLGALSGENSNYCWLIEIYDATQMSSEDMEYALEEVEDGRAFFLKDKTDKIYFVFTDLD